MAEQFTETRGVDLSFTIFEKVLLFKEYKDEKEVLRVAQAMAKVAEKNPDYEPYIKNAYAEAFRKLSLLTFEEMKEIIEIIKD